MIEKVETDTRWGLKKQPKYGGVTGRITYAILDHLFTYDVCPPNSQYSTESELFAE